jgi:hypothetical protein
MYKLTLFAVLLLSVPIIAYSQQQRLDPTQANVLPSAAALGGNQLSGNPNQPLVNQVAPNLNVGVAPVAGVGQATKGVGNQTTGYGAQVSGYGANVPGTKAPQGCNTYPPSPYDNTCR